MIEQKLRANKVNDTWATFWFVTAIFAALSLWPFVVNSYPGMSDYPNHLARLHLLTNEAAKGWEQFYTIQHEIVANLALDLIASGFVKLGLLPEVALKSFAAIAYFLVIAGVYAVACATNKNPPWLVIWTFLFAFNRYYIWGFLNYFFSVGLGLLLFAFWIKTHSFKKVHQGLYQYLIGILLIFVMISHLMGYGIAVLCIVIYEFNISFHGENKWSKCVNHLFKIALILLPSVLFYFFVCQHGSNHEVVYQNVVRSKISGLLSPFLSYSIYQAFFYLFAFAFSIYWLIKQVLSNPNSRQIVYSKKSHLIPVILFLLAIVLPSAMMGSYYLDRRVFVVALLLGVALASFKFERQTILIVVFIALTSHLIKVAEINQIWSTYSKDAEAITQALNKIEKKSKIEGYSFGDDSLMPVPPLQHMVSFAIFQKAAYVPTLFAKPINEESVAFKSPYDKRAYTTGTYEYKDSLVIMRYVCDYHQKASYYDYVLVTFMENKPEVPSCLDLIATGQHFNLYQVLNAKVSDQQLN